MTLDILSVPSFARLVPIDAEPGRGLYWQEIQAEAVRRSRDLPAGAKGRQVFGISADNGVETLLRIFSVLACGAIPAPFPSNTEPSVVAACLKRIGASGLWTADDGWQAEVSGRQFLPGFDLIMHSSGSTGVPKPLAIRLEAMRRNALDVASFLGLTTSDVHLGAFSHCYMSGLFNATVLPLVTGGVSVSAPLVTMLTLGSYVAAIERHRPTVLWLSPLVARLVSTLKGVSAEMFSSVRFAISCTAPLTPMVKNQFEERFSVPLLQSYGLCETLITTIENPAAPCAGSAGRPVGRAGALWIDDRDQVVVANGAHFAGYLDQDRNASPLVPVEPYETGDIGRIDPDGNLHVTGRMTETINRDGTKFAPEAVESIMNALPGVQDSALVGVEDQTLGVRLIAFVVADLSSVEDLHATLRADLPSIQRPHEIRLVTQLPRTISGKIDRTSLKKSMHP